jgi:hypothetical protein
LLCDLLFMVYSRVQTTCGEDTQKCNFSHCFPECEDSVFSEVSVAYQTTRIPRSEFWYVPASLNCDFEMYLQVWTVILKCACKCELWASLMHKTFHLCGLYLVFCLWFAGFVMRLYLVFCLWFARFVMRLYLVFCLWFAGFVMRLLEKSGQCQILFLPTYLMQ